MSLALPNQKLKKETSLLSLSCGFDFFATGVFLSEVSEQNHLSMLRCP